MLNGNIAMADQEIEERDDELERSNVHDLRGVDPAKERWTTFEQIVQERRAVRYFDPSVEVPDGVFERAIDMAMLTPSASNLQPWYFVRVKDPEVKAKMIPLCMDQPSVKSASELIVCMGRTDRWRERAERLQNMFEEQGVAWPQPYTEYYTKLVPLTYVQGPLGILGFIKRVVSGTIRLIRPLSSAPCSHGEMRTWALKNTALATMNLMLALQAQGYDTCPLDGFDHGRVKKLLDLPRAGHIFLVLCVGKRSPEDAAAWGPRMRLPRDEHFAVV